MSPAPLLAADGLGRSVEGRTLWSGLSFRLEAGDRGVLLGRSGSGKTLMMRTLAALECPEDGAVRFEGRPFDSMPLPEYRARVTYVAQKAFLVGGTVRDNLRFPFDFAAHSGRTWSEEAAFELLGALSRDDDFLDRPADTLSGGEGQIVGLVRALLLEPRVLLLDEPTSSLDPETTERVERLLFRWVDEGSRALLWTSHDSAQTVRVRHGPAIDLEAT